VQAEFDVSSVWITEYITVSVFEFYLSTSSGGFQWAQSATVS
jgi:hypothetical protein